MQGLDGLAHLLEHSMFLGSKSWPERCVSRFGVAGGGVGVGDWELGVG